jgi:rhodanese-related sulfurtransferase
MGTMGSLIKSMLGLGVSDPTSEVSPKDAFERLKGNKTIQLVDVRSEAEFKEGYISGARSIPLQELGSRTGEINQNGPVLLYCHSGARSGMALALLKGKGYSQIAHISGGVSAWKRNNLPLETQPASAQEYPAGQSCSLKRPGR